MKRTNELVSRVFMKTLKSKLLKLSDREFNIVSPAITDLVYQVADLRSTELREWKDKQVQKLDLQQ